MYGHIPVRMCDAAYWALDPYPAQHKRKTRAEGVDIISVTYSNVIHTGLF